MSNENKPNENQDILAQPDAATTPIDLASAFKMLNQANREAAQEFVDEGNNNQQIVENEERDNGGPGDSGEAGQIISNESVVSGTESGDGTGDDRPADSIEAIDFNAYKQDLLRNIQRDAATQVRREFDEQNIGYYSAAELTIRDEQTGQIRFRNPDVQDERDPNYYFKSRSDMQQFITAWNQGVDYEYRKAVNEKQRELLQQEAPRAALIDFIPKFQAMTPAAQQVFDMLLNGHEIKDANGQAIGFNVNLDEVAHQAISIANSFNSPNVAAQQAPQAASESTSVSNEPALDAKTGNGESKDEKEPTNIGEALKMFDKKNKKGK